MKMKGAPAPQSTIFPLEIIALGRVLSRSKLSLKHLIEVGYFYRSVAPTTDIFYNLRKRVRTEE